MMSFLKKIYFTWLLLDFPMVTFSISCKPEVLSQNELEEVLFLDISWHDAYGQAKRSLFLFERQGHMEKEKQRS